MSNKNWKNNLFVKLTVTACLMLITTSITLVYEFKMNAKEVEGELLEYKKSSEKRIDKLEASNSMLKFSDFQQKTELKLITKRIETLCEKVKTC